MGISAAAIAGVLVFLGVQSYDSLMEKLEIAESDVDLAITAAGTITQEAESAVAELELQAETAKATANDADEMLTNAQAMVEASSAFVSDLEIKVIEAAKTVESPDSPALWWRSIAVEAFAQPIVFASSSCSPQRSRSLPFGFHHAGQAGPALWMGSSAIQLVSWVSIFLVLGIRFRPDFENEPLSNSVSVALYGLSFLIPILQVANIIDWPMESGPLLYLAGLILWLVTTSFLFALLVVFGARE